jgi:hypothetical protein
MATMAATTTTLFVPPTRPGLLERAQREAQRVNEEYATEFAMYLLQCDQQRLVQQQQQQQALCQVDALTQPCVDDLDNGLDKAPANDVGNVGVVGGDGSNTDVGDEPYQLSCSVCDAFASFRSHVDHDSKHVLWARSLLAGQAVDYRRNTQSQWQSAWVAWVLQPGVYVMALQNAVTLASSGNGRGDDTRRGNLTTTQSTETLAGCDTLSPSGWHTHRCPPNLDESAHPHPR